MTRNQAVVVVLAAVAGLVGCVGAPPCASDSCVASEPQEDAFAIRLTGLDEERGCWGKVSYLNVPWEYVRSVPTNERTGCLFDLRTQQAYDTPQFGYDLDYEVIGWHPCDVEHGYAPGADADGPPLCTNL